MRQMAKLLETIQTEMFCGKIVFVSSTGLKNCT